MYRTLIRSLSFFFLMAVAVPAGAQCVSITNLPDTVDACKNTTVQLSPQVTGTSTNLRILDTFWTPSAGLSNPDIINPVVTAGTTSRSYTLTVTALTSNNFVNNGNFSAGSTGFTTAYAPGFGGTFGLLSNEGTYAVTSNPSLVHTNFASFPDHTGNPGGQMLVVNGSSTANTNIWCQTITVVPNSQYDFSAWGASTTNTNPAVIQFAINGVLLGTPLSLSTTNGLWSQFHAVWNSGSNTSIDICINDQQTAPSGNDFAIDDIEFRLICMAKDSVFVRVTNLQPTITKTVHFGCSGDTVAFQAGSNAGGETPDQFQWNFGDNTGSTLGQPVHIYNTQGLYNVKLITKKRGCIDSTTTTVDTRHPLTVGVKVDEDTICLGGSSQFDNTADNSTTAPSYFYDFGDGTTGTTSNPSHTYAAVGTYIVKHAITDQVPCSDTARVTVTVVAAPTADFEVSSEKVCQGNNIDFLATVTPGYDTLLWNYGDGTVLFDTTTTRHAYDNSGNFPITLTVGYPQCPTLVVNKAVEVYPFPNVNLGPDSSICPNGDALVLANQVYNSGTTNQWSTGETSNSIFVTHPGSYWLSVENAGGCIAADSITIRNACYLDIPNAFTPNGDGNNDYFFPRELLSSRLTKFRMQIFNRWGALIFETTSLTGRGWDGRFNDKAQPQGAYIYLIEGQVNGGATEKYKGTVTLLR